MIKCVLEYKIHLFIYKFILKHILEYKMYLRMYKKWIREYEMLFENKILNKNFIFEMINVSLKDWGF